MKVTWWMQISSLVEANQPPYLSLFSPRHHVRHLSCQDPATQNRIHGFIFIHSKGRYHFILESKYSFEVFLKPIY